MTTHATGIASALKILEDLATEHLPIEEVDRAKAALYVLANDVGDLERELEQARQEAMASEGEVEKAEGDRDAARDDLARFIRDFHDRYHRGERTTSFRFCTRPVCDEAVQFFGPLGLAS